MSRLLTAVLVSHLGWVPTVIPSGTNKNYVGKSSAKWVRSGAYAIWYFNLDLSELHRFYSFNIFLIFSNINLTVINFISQRWTL